MVFRKLFLLVFMTLAVCTESVYADLQHPCSSSYPCAAGYYCSNGSCIACHIGHYCINNNEYICPDYTFAAQEQMSACQRCPDEIPYANQSHIDCMACGTGAFYVDGGVCVPCPSGQYANPEHTECVTCDDGTVSEGVCMPECKPGRYLSTDGVCLECKAGYYCVGGQAGMKICPKDTYSSSAQSECIKCPDGYVTESAGTGYVVGTDLTNICRKQKAVLKIGSGTETSLPVYLREGRINRAVVRVKNN